MPLIWLGLCRLVGGIVAVFTVPVRGNAATSLGNLGSAAKAAAPQLLQLLRDTNSYVSGTVGDRAAQMLLKIDPEVATKAGVK